ncbi:hypothetical protein N0V83_000101 [Neocucurbitaria cava]|uniref:Uncharacterized protein n=1 Tax=Neocucurbitaria cava TaxID=798079 RepID=A0A9W8YG37_9PLEO|nr:hypothetical protein N0V83_000101 [Neocucurbitaria cava]
MPPAYVSTPSEESDSMADAPVRTPPSLDEQVVHDHDSHDGFRPVKKFPPGGSREGTKRNLFEVGDSNLKLDMSKGTGQVSVADSNQQMFAELYKAQSGTLSDEEKHRFLLLLTRHNELMAAEAAGGLQEQLPQSIPTTMPLRFKRKATLEEQKENPFPRPSKDQWPRANFVTLKSFLSAGDPSTQFSSLGNVESDAPRNGTAPKPEKGIYCRKCRNAGLKVCHEEKVPATEAAFHDFYGSSNGSAWSAPLSGEGYGGLGGALSKHGSASTREPSCNENENSYARWGTGLNNTSWGAGENDTDTCLNANGGRAGGNSNWDEGSVAVAPKSSHWGSTSVCSDTSARTTLNSISGSGIDLCDANTPKAKPKAKPKTAVPTGYTVTYWATIEAGDQVVNIPIDSANVSGAEKTIIDGGDSGMMKAWKWVQEKGLANKVSLEDAFDLAKELHDQVTKTTGPETLGQEEIAEEQTMGDAFGDNHMVWSCGGVPPSIPYASGWCR